MSRRGSEPEATRRPAGRDHWLARPETIRLLWVVFIGILAATVVADVFVRQHADFGVEDTLGFYAWYGFLTCVAMIVVAKGLSVLLKRSDRYYGD